MNRPVRIRLTQRRWTAMMFLLLALVAAQARADLEQVFRNPPQAAKPWVYWFWINGNITKGGITADLEAMARAGIGGVLIMEVARPGNMAPEGNVAFASPQWREMFRHTVTEAGRLGMQITMNNDAGWCGSGGPWITPELSMQDMVATSTVVTGPQRYRDKLPQPMKRRGYYRDLEVLAFPQAEPGGRDAVSVGEVRDLTALTDAGGTLTWDVPEGRWQILRLGVTTTGSVNKPAPASGRGLECDKFQGGAAQFHIDSFIGKLAKDNAADVGKVFAMTHIDSWEVGAQDWTSDMPGEFRKRRGYELTPWLAALAGGATVGSPEQTARFLWDFNRTRSQLTDDRYAGALRKAAAAHGVKLSIEAYGGHVGFLNPLTYGAEADLPMAEFWIGRWEAWHLHTSRLMASVAHQYGKPVVGAESFTSMADNDPFTEHPYTVKATGDWAFCEGINRHVFHRSVLNPWPGQEPGMAFAGWGWHADRTQTWWENAGTAFVQYLARCQALLQEGQAVADICRLVPDGENFGHRPAMSTLPAQYDAIPPGYNFDYISDKALLELVTVKDGRLVTPAGMSYRLLQLPNNTTMTVELAEKVRDLVKAGARVAGPKPERAPGLTDYPRCDGRVREIASEIWSECDGVSVTERPLGEGRIFWGRSLASVLARETGGPDVEFVLDPPVTEEGLRPLRHGGGYGTPRETVGIMPTPGLNWIHRRTAHGDVYFLANPQPREVEALVSFRSHGLQPEAWDPATGLLHDLPVFGDAGNRTRIPLRFDPAGSVFVVFRRKADKRMQIAEVRRDGVQLFGDEQAGPQRMPEIRFDGESATLVGGQGGRYELLLADGRRQAVGVEPPSPPTELSAPWSVSFQSGRGAPEKAEFPQLSDWSGSADPGIRYFSGTATYRTALVRPSDGPTSATAPVRWQLDLGDVQVIAQVIVNGKDLGVLWKPPYRVDVTTALQPGRNELEIKVTNLWPNRLIGDEQRPDDCTPDASWTKGPIPAWPDWLLKEGPRPDSRRLTFTTWKHFSKDSPLLPSGLIGPVRLRAESELRLKPTQ